MQAWLAWIRELEAKGHLKHPGQPLDVARQGRARKTQDRDRRPVCRSEGPGPRLHRRGGAGPRRGGGAFEGLPHARRWRIGGDSPGRDVERVGAGSGSGGASLPARVGAHGRRADAHLRRAQPGAGRGRRPGRVLPSARSVEGARHSGEPVGVAHGDGEEPRARRHSARSNGADLCAGDGPAARERMDDRAPSSRRHSPRTRFATSSCG